MFTNLHLRLWNDSAFIRNRTEIAEALRHQVKPQDITTTEGLREFLKEIRPAISLGDAFDQHRAQDSDFANYHLMYCHAEPAFSALLATLRLIHQCPYSYLPAREGKQVTKGNEALTLQPDDEASFMKLAVILTVLNEELRNVQDTKTPKRAA